MGKVMRQMPFGCLMESLLAEYRRAGSIFGVKKFYRKTNGQNLEIFGEKLELPFGPAAGPHTQLAQNLIASYVAGARFFELKTVQILDGEDLPVSKPCILAQDECYNVEWSTELYVPQAMDEYIKGWFALKLLSRELGLGCENGFVFNMSVGYDLAGIKTEKINSYIEGLVNAESTGPWKICKEWALDNLQLFENVNREYVESISPEICRSITISTLHGCPPDEIERIATYLLTEKKLHTFIKCNPTLLGYDYARKTLDDLGFDYIAFDDHHFKADLQFDDAVPMLGRLQKLADDLSLAFGVKITNTFPVQITAGELPGGEMYMSGRSLHPLSLEVANRLSKAFGGKLRISYSGGAEFRNIGGIYNAGIWPITLATTLLKPGGYQRLNQIAAELDECGSKPFTGVSLPGLQALVDNTKKGPLYRKSAGQPPQRKIKEKVPLLDCFMAPCRGGCPFGQDVPAYLRLAGEGKHLEALRVITERNPLPFITGTICSHRCMEKCTRNFYENSVGIRSVKLDVAEEAFGQLLAGVAPSAKSGGKVAIIGGGPAGLAAAYFLAKAGRPVTIFEKRTSLGGVVRHVIPGFRISNEAIDNDVKLVLAMGVETRLNTDVKSLEELTAEGFESIIVATGAWKPGKLELKEGVATDALVFLEQHKSDPQSVRPGANVVVVGGGNTAMDTARAAKRVAGVNKVSLVYRRTKRYMPADAEELELAVEDGVEFRELLAPVTWKNGMLICDLMELGAPDASGRRSPVATGKTVEIAADTVISAIGNLADNGAFAAASGETAKVYYIGDAAKGPSTVAEAIADAMRCAADCAGVCTERYAGLNVNPDFNAAEVKKGVLYKSVADGTDGKDSCSVCETKRCLECATICECCVDVCPNRANISVIAGGRPQIVHIDSMCNECGNCEVFCPYSSAPYLDKFTYFEYEEDFEKSKNSGFLRLGDNTFRVRLNGETSVRSDGSNLPDGLWQLILAVISR